MQSRESLALRDTLSASHQLTQLLWGDVTPLSWYIYAGARFPSSCARTCGRRDHCATVVYKGHNKRKQLLHNILIFTLPYIYYGKFAPDAFGQVRLYLVNFYRLQTVSLFASRMLFLSSASSTSNFLTNLELFFSDSWSMLLHRLTLKRFSMEEQGNVIIVESNFNQRDAFRES